MAKLGIFSWFSFQMPIADRLRKIRQAGFDATSLWWEGVEKDKAPDFARKQGLEVAYAHAPFDNADSLWMDDLAGEEYLNSLLSCVGGCKTHEIPTAVIHITGFSDPPPVSETGLNRVKRLVDLAEREEVNLAFENLNYLQHLDTIFEGIDSKRLGFCYDSGHENYRHPNADCLARYGQRLFAVHLDDNNGDKDSHLLPYDGTIDWQKVMRGIEASRKVDCLTLEVDFDENHEKGVGYKRLSADEFLALAYTRANRLLSE